MTVGCILSETHLDDRDRLSHVDDCVAGHKSSVCKQGNECGWQDSWIECE